MNLMELMVKIGGDTSGLDKAIGGVNSKIAHLGASVLKGTAKTAAALVAGAATGIAAITKSSVSAYKNYEQLTGGVQTLFGTASYEVMQNAKNAFATAGLSMNDYMDAVNGMAASLKQSLGGSVSDAAKYADMAVKDMADNANKMGTSMEAIQNAYAGFSKQNYTMLDNLKLGYGGTKQEMQRLLKDAKAMKAAQGEYVDYSIDSYADIVDAIHTVQMETGIYGTTAKEAATTIEGSLNATKSAWQNVLTTMGTGNASEMKKAIDGLVTSVVGSKPGEGLLNRLAPAVTNAIEGIGTLIQKAAPIISQQLPVLIEKILPPFTNALVTMLQTAIPVLATMLPELISTLAPALIQAFSALVTTLIKEWPAIWAALKDAFNQLWAEIKKALNENFNGLGDTIEEIVNKLIDFAPVILTLVGAFEALSIVGKIGKAFKDVSEDVKVLKGGFDLLSGKLTSLWGWITGTAIPAITSFITAALPVIGVIAAIAAAIAAVILVVKNWDKILDFLKGFGEAFVEVWGEIFDAIGEVLSGIWDAFQSWGDTIVEFWAGVFGGMRDKAVEIWNAVGDFLKGVWSDVTNFFVNLWNGLKDTAANIWNGITSAISDAVTAVWNFLSNVWNNIVNSLTNVWNGIKNTAADLWNGICSTISGLVDGVKTWLSDTWENIKNTASEKWNNLKAAAAEKWESIKSTVRDKIETLKQNLAEKWNTIKQKASETWDNIKSGLSSKIEGLKSTAREMAEGVKNAIKSVWDKAKEWGSELGQKMASGLKSAYGWLKDAASGAANTVSQWLHFTRPDVGPLRYYEQWMPDFMEGLANGIEGNRWRLEEALAGVTGGIDSAVTSVNPTVNTGSTTVNDEVGGGDIIIPFYLDGTLIDERVVKAQQIHDFKSGGR
jgi:phage-related protein